MLTPEFFVTSLIVILIPGTGAVYTISIGLSHGWRASVAAAIGCTAGILPHVAASILGLSVVLQMSAVAFHGLKVAGAIYVLYLAWAMWHDQGALTFAASPTRNPRRIIMKAIGLNLLNPKLTLFFVAFLPLFLAPTTGTPTTALWILSAVFMGMTFIVFVGYGAVASSVRRYVVNSPPVMVWLRRSCAAAFVALAVHLALNDR